MTPVKAGADAKLIPVPEGKPVGVVVTVTGGAGGAAGADDVVVPAGADDAAGAEDVAGDDEVVTADDVPDVAAGV